MIKLKSKVFALYSIVCILIFVIGLVAYIKFKTETPTFAGKQIISKSPAVASNTKQSKNVPQAGPVSKTSILQPMKNPLPVVPVNGKTDVIRSFDQELSDWKGKFDAGTRSRKVSLKPEFLQNMPIKEGRELSFQLFDDIRLDAVVTTSFKNVNDTISTTAKVKGSKMGRVFIACTDGQLQARMRIPEENKIYAIEYNHNTGMHYALELDIALAEPPEGLDDALQPLPRGDGGEVVKSQPLSVPVIAGDEAVDTSYVVDIMVVYTDDALVNAGSQAAMDNQIALAMSYSNDAHTNTNTMIVFNLVHSYEITYTETGSNSTDLYWVDGDSGVASNRNTYGADFTIMMNATGSGGVAWVLTQSAGRADLAFCVVDDNSFVSYTPVHEVGHNMGLSHAADQNFQPGPTGGDFGNYSAGWHWHPTPGASGYCSVMTYTNGTYFADGLAHTRVGLFSDPDLTDHGEIAGNASTGDNTRVLTAMGSVYVTYRDRNISSNTIQVDSPDGGETLTADNTYSINWDSNGVAGNVKIELYKNAVLDRQIVASTLNDRVYSWTIPSDVTGTGYSIKISNLADTITDSSDATFSVNKTFYTESLNSNPGYTATGTWEYGVPVSVDNVTYGGPGEAYTGTNIYDTDLDYVSFIDSNLTTTAIDCSNYSDVVLRFMGQFSVSNGDYAKVQVSNDGTNWTELYSATDLWATAWTTYEYDISSVADAQSTVYIRWAYDDATGNSRSGMAVDDITVQGILTAPPAGIFELSSATYAVDENVGGGVATITVKRVGGSAGAVSVDYATSNGTATSGVDYTATTGTLNWADGDVADKTFTVTISDDAIYEGDETVSVTLSNPTGTTISGTNPATLTITENDSAPTVTLGVDTATIAEASGVATFTATLSAVAGVDVTVDLAFSGTATGSGTDYTASGSQIVISAGAPNGTITVTADQDTLDEDNETVIVDIDSVTNGTETGTQQATTTITDDDAPPSVAFTSAAQASAAESGTMTITAQLSTLSGRDVTVPFSVNGASTATSVTDYAITASPITISAGNSSASVTVTIVSDTIDEVDETVVVDMGAPTNASQGATIVHTATITDDDTATISIDDVTVLEVDTAAISTAQFTVSLSTTSSRTVTVDYATADVTTTAGVDYVAIVSTTLTFTPGDTTKTVDVTVNGDFTDESDETFTVDLSNPIVSTISDAQGVGTITDDDTSYTLTVDNGTGDGAIVDGDTVTIIANAAQTGQIFDKWTGDVANVANVNASTTTIVMPAGNTTVVATYIVNAATAEKITYGSKIKVYATQVSDMDTEFTKRPKIYGKYTDPIKTKAYSSITRGITKISTSSPANIFECLWNRSVMLYNKTSLRNDNKTGTTTAGWLTANPTQNVDLECELWANSTTVAKSKLESFFRGALIVPPTITSVERWDGGVIGNVHSSSVIIVKGNYFGSKAPTVSLEYTDPVGGIAIKQKRLKVLKPYKYDDDKGKPERSCMDLTSATGASEIQVEMPKKWWTGWVAGSYDLVLENKIGIDTVPINTIDSSVSNPTTTADTVTLHTGDSSYYIDVLANDTDTDSDAMTIIPDTSGGTLGKVAVSKGKIRYTPPKGVLPGAFPDTFTYILSDVHGGTSATALVTVNMNAIALDPLKHWDGTALGAKTVQPGSLIMITGQNFGVKAPTVMLAIEGGKNLKLKVQATPEYEDYKLKANKSYTDVDSASGTFGDSKIIVEMPKKAWSDYGTSSPYTLTVSNKFDTAGATDTIATTAVDTAPVANDDAVTILSGSRFYYIDVLADNGSGADTDAESDKMTIVLPSKTSITHGAKLTIDKKTNTVKYSRAKTVLCGFTDTFTYSLVDPSGTPSTGTATVTITGSVAP